MYIVLGSDQKEYGPIDAATVRQWVSQGRLTPISRIRAAEAVEWTEVRALPEFQDLGIPASYASPMPTARPAKTSGLAIASLVLGILGGCTAGVTALVGLILGIVALVKINRSNGQLGGQGLAIGGLCVSGVMVLMIPMMAAIAIPNFVKARSTAQRNMCINNLRQLDGAKEQWALELKKTAADTPGWSDLVGPMQYIKNKPVCPANGTYTLGKMVEQPTCSIPEHRLTPFTAFPSPVQNSINARVSAQKNACINNLRMLDGAKEQWALEFKKSPTDTPIWTELVGPMQYIKMQLACPANGTYTLGNMTEKPTCSIPGHSLPTITTQPQPGKR